MLPSVNAAASSPLYSCVSWTFCVTGNQPCNPVVPGSQIKYLAASCANGWGEWPIGCCGVING